MSIMIGLESAMRGMRSSTAAINTITHNIANMNTEGYSKQIANIATTMPLTNLNGAGQIGTGSYASNIERVRDAFLDRQIMSDLEQLGKWEMLSKVYDNLRALFPEVDNPGAAGIQQQLTNFYNSWGNLVDEIAKPVTDPTRDVTGAKNAILSNAKGLATLMNEKSAALTAMQISMNGDIRENIMKANALLQEIAEYNKQIITVSGLGQNPNDTLDKRSLALKQLAEIINIDVGERTDGSVVVHIQGHTMVSGGNFYALTTVGNDKDSKLEGVGLYEYRGAPPVDITDLIFKGKLAGIIDGRDDVLEGYKIELDTLAHSIITVVNNVHQTGVDSSGAQTNTDFFVGTRAASIAVNPDISNGNDINDTKYVEGDIAEILANLENKVMSNFVVRKSASPLSENATLNNDGILRINGIDIYYSATDTVADLVQKINLNVETISAVYDQTNNQFFMIANDYVTMEEFRPDGTAALPLPGPPPYIPVLSQLGLVQEQVSAAPVNYPGALTGGTVKFVYQWDQQMDLLDVEPIENGVIKVSFDGQSYEIPWQENYPVIVTVGGIYSFNPSGTPMEVSYFSESEQKFHFGQGVNSGAGENRVLPVILSDKFGNMTKTMKLIGDVRFGEFYDSIVGKLSGDIFSTQNIKNQYQQSVELLENVQNEITKVDEEEQIAQAKLYQRAYDASVRLMAIIDQMLNMLINRTASPSSSDD